MSCSRQLGQAGLVGLEGQRGCRWGSLRAPASRASQAGRPGYYCAFSVGKLSQSLLCPSRLLPRSPPTSLGPSFLSVNMLMTSFILEKSCVCVCFEHHSVLPTPPPFPLASRPNQVVSLVSEDTTSYIFCQLQVQLHSSGLTTSSSSPSPDLGILCLQGGSSGPSHPPRPNLGSVPHPKASPLCILHLREGQHHAPGHPARSLGHYSDPLSSPHILSATYSADFLLWIPGLHSPSKAHCPLTLSLSSDPAFSSDVLHFRTGTQL